MSVIDFILVNLQTYSVQNATLLETEFTADFFSECIPKKQAVLKKYFGKKVYGIIAFW